MTSVRTQASKSGRRIALLVTMVLVVAPASAVAQETEPLTGTRLRIDGFGAQAARPRPGPRGRPFVAALFTVPLVTFAGPQGARDSETVFPADRFAITQIVGAGYVVNPKLRFGVVGLFNEVLTGLPPTVDAWQFGGLAPIAIGTFGHFIVGGGPIIGYRSGGQQQKDAGAVLLSGASIPVGRGVALNIAAPVTALVMHRRTVSFGVAIGVAKVF